MMTLDGLTSLPGDFYSWIVGYDVESQPDPQHFDVSVVMRVIAVATVALAGVVTALTAAIPVLNAVTLLAGITTSLYAHDFFVCGEALKSDKSLTFLFCTALGIEQPVLETVGALARFVRKDILLHD